MSDDAEQVWLIPTDYAEMAPLPALRRGDEIFLYSRSSKSFTKDPDPLLAGFNCDSYSSFEECRAAMIEDRIKVLDMHRQICRDHATAIEHIKTIPTQQFPNVIREIRETQQETAQGQTEGQGQAAKEVKPLRRPAGRGNG